MSYYDDDDKYDDDLSYDDDYEEDVDDEGEENSKDSSIRSRINPYSGSSSGLPGRDRAGGGSSGSREELSSRLRNSTSPPPTSGGGIYNRPQGGSGSSSSGTSGTGGGTPGSGGDRPRSSSPFTSSSSSNNPRPFGSGSSSSGAGSNSPRPFSSGSSGSGSNFGNRSTFGSSSRPEDRQESSKEDDRKDEKPRFGTFGSRPGGDKPAEEKKPDDKSGSGSGTSRFGGAGSGITSRFGGGSDKPAEEKKPEEKKPDDKSGSGGGTSRFGGITSRFGGGGDKPSEDKKPEEKKPDSSPAGGIGNRLGGLTGGLTSRFGGGSDKPSEEKKPDAGSRLGGLTGGITSRFGGGSDKPAESKKPEEKKPDSGTGSGIGSRLGGLTGGLTSRFGGGSDKPAESKKPEEKKPDSGTGSGIGSRLGGLTGGITSRFGGGDKPAETSATSKPASTSAPASTTTGPRFGSAFPAKTSTPPSPGGDKPATPKGTTAKPAETGQGFFASLAKRLPIGFGNADDKKAAAKAGSKTRASKVPQAASEGMSLDTKLDILGVVLIFVSLVLFLSSLSSEQGKITAGINQFFSQWFGLGAIAVPMVMMAAGVWLVLRHFGEDAPEIDLVRISGLALLYITLLILFQYAESFDPIYGGSFETYQLLSPKTIEFGRGGGRIGWTLYNFLVQNATEAGGAAVAVGMLIIGIMLLTRTSAAELAVIVISVYRSFQVSMQRRAQRRAAARLAAQQATPIAPPQITIAKPAVAELPAGNPPVALPSPMPMTLPETEAPVPVATEDRPITIRTGGRTLTSSEPAPMTRVPPIVRPAANAAPAKPEEETAGSGGFAARLRQAVPAALPWGSKSEDGEKPQPEKKEEGGGLRGMFGRKPAADGADAAKPPVPAPIKADGGTPARPASPFTPVSPVSRPADTKPDSTPAAASAAPSSTPASPPEDFFKPATPKGIITSTGPAVPADGVKETPVEEVKPTSEAPAASATTAPEMEAATPSRVDRLNELRQGVLSPRPRPFTPSTSDAAGKPVPDGQKGEAPAASAAPASAPAPIGPAVSNAPKITLPSVPTAVPGQTATPQPQQPTLQRVRRNYTVPDYRTLLSPGSEQDFDRESLVKKARMIEETLDSFGAPGRVVEINTGPVITQFGVEPGYLTSRGGNKSRVKVGAIAQLDKDLQLALGARSIRVEAPVPGKGYVGVEVPNDKPATVSLRDVMEAKEFQRIKSPLAIGLGQSVDGAPVAADLTSMPHLLIAGTTGSGKSVCVNSIIASLLLRNSPEIVKFIMVDPKRVELTGYNGIPHLVAPVVVELERIVGVLKWVTREMDERYKKFSNAGARNIEDYNKHLNPNDEPLPYIVVIIDELADLMMLAPEETERTITRIAALARATGIHLVIATQRPSVDVVTGLIKANFPARIAFAVAGGVDSRVILDQPGAERLLGRGDMLYMSGDSPAPLRLQGVFVSDTEINNIVRYWRSQQLDDAPQRPITALVMEDSASETARPAVTGSPRTFGTLQTPAPARSGQAFWEEDDDDEDEDIDDRDAGGEDGEDELYEEAVEMVRRLGKASVSLLQRRLRIGYTRAARLIDLMEERGVVGPATEGSKPREVLR